MLTNRIVALRERMDEGGLDALLVSSMINIRYLTGFTGSHGLLVITGGSQSLLTDSRYRVQARAQVRGTHIIITTLDPFEEAARRKFLARAKRVGFEAHQVTYAQYRKFRKLFPHVAFASTANMVEEGMLVKAPDEVRLIRRAAEISDRVFEKILGVIRPGIREREVAAEISYLHKRFGADRDAFETIVASGERGALPHGRASDKKIRSGELVTMDFGCVVGGYHSDITRTIAVGKPSVRAREMHDAVLEAQHEAVASARGGMPAKDVDAVARKRIAQRGFGRYFNHSLGHGLGLQVHEPPKVSQLSKETLRAGSVITIEPGVYIPGFGGVRIEDDVVLTDKGCDLLTNASRELIIV